MSSRGPSSTPARTGSTLWRAPDRLATALVAALVLVLSATLGGPPAPLPADAPPAAFAAGRAEAVLLRLVGDGAPHAAGTPANRALRLRLEAELRALGLTPEVQAGWRCAATCVWLENVIAPIPGASSGRVVLVAAHYDGVAAGPGVADNLAGVAAALEVARALLAGGPTDQPVALLFSDGEEEGMLGAALFGAHPLAARVAAVVNLDARGTGGRSYLFETGPANAWTIAHYAERAPHPATHSLYRAIYRLLPNGTDFTVFRERGAEGANLAFIAPVARYHTPRDDLAHLDRASLQHHGENALALARGFAAEASLAGPVPAGEAVYFDVLNQVLVSWPAGVNPAIVAALGLGWAVVVARTLLRRRARSVELLFGLAWPLVGVGLALALGALIGAVTVALTGHPAPWWAAGTAFQVLYGLVALTGLLAAAALLGRRAGGFGTFLGVGTWWMALALILAIALPGATPVALVPALGALLGGVAHLVWRRRDDPAPLGFPIVLAWLTWLPLAAALPKAMTFADPWIAVGPSLALLWPLAPLMARRGYARTRYVALVGAGGLVAVGLVWVVASPRATADLPARANLLAVQDGDETGGWVHLELPRRLAAGAGTLPREFVDAFERLRAQTPDPLGASVEGSAAVPPFALPAPDVAVAVTAGEGTGRYALTITSRRGAAALLLCARGHVALPDGTASTGFSEGRGCVVHRIMAGAVGPLRLRLDAAAGESEVQVGDETPGVPSSARALAAARGDTVVPWQRGDRTVVWRRVALTPTVAP